MDRGVCRVCVVSLVTWLVLGTAAVASAQPACDPTDSTVCGTAKNGKTMEPSGALRNPACQLPGHGSTCFADVMATSQIEGNLFLQHGGRIKRQVQETEGISCEDLKSSKDCEEAEECTWLDSECVGPVGHAPKQRITISPTTTGEFLPGLVTIGPCSTDFCCTSNWNPVTCQGPEGDPGRRHNGEHDSPEHFWITSHMDTRVCIESHTGRGWGHDVVVTCQEGGARWGVGGRPSSTWGTTTTPGAWIDVQVGDSGHSFASKKCITTEGNLQCPDSLSLPEAQLNFSITTSPQPRVCAQRIDVVGPWSMNLQVVCAAGWEPVFTVTTSSFSVPTTSSMSTTTTTTTTTTTVTTGTTTVTTGTTSTTATTTLNLGMFVPISRSQPNSQDQVCRGGDPNDNSGSYFTVVTVKSLSECRQKCLEMEHQLCKGIEYSGFSRCELWTRPEGIRSTATLRGFTCEANKDAPVFWSNYYFLEGAENRACRHMHPEDNDPSYYKLVEDIFKLEDCQAQCMVTRGCKGMEYSYGRCEVWTSTIASVKAIDPAKGRSVCMIYEPWSGETLG